MKKTEIYSITGIKRKIHKDYFNSDEYLGYNEVFEKMASVAHRTTPEITKHKYQFNNSRL